MSRRLNCGSRPLRGRYRRLAWAGRWCGLAGLGALAFLATACDEPEAPQIVAQLGCGLDDDRIGTLRVEARGDFVPGKGTQVVLSGGDGELAWGGRSVVAVTVEGLFGQRVEAVGRTARLRESGEIPVYFAPVDSVCAMPGSLAPRRDVATAVGETGDVVVVGGRDAQGRLLDDVLTLHDETGELRELPGGLPFPSVGQTVHALDERRFVVVGGAGSNPTALRQIVRIDLDLEDNPIGDPVTINASDELGPARAFHAGARMGDGRILVVGGCEQLTPDARCAVGEALGGDELPQRSLWLAVEGGLSAEVGPDVAVPRFGARLLLGRDGVAFLAGGWDADGMPVHVVERLRPEATRFRPYGGDLRSALDDDLAVTGAALLEGGLVVLTLADGRIYWVNEAGRDDYLPWGDFCVQGEACFRDLSAAFPATTRGVLTLDGERVLADGVVLPIGGIGRDGGDVVDLFESGPSASRPSWRVGSVPIRLADGSVVLIGGHDPDSGALAQPLALRVRPDLDGPDERIPEVDRSAVGNMVASDLDQVSAEGETLRFLANEGADVQFPRVRAHARGFRSASFRFEATVHATSGQAVPHIVLQHGAVEAVSISLGTERVVANLRDPQGRVQVVSCGNGALDVTEPRVLRVDVQPDAVVVQSDGVLLAQCPMMTEPRAWSVGIGAAGAGEMLASSLRLSRQH